MGFVIEGAGSHGYECLYSQSDLHNLVRMDLFDARRHLLLPLIPLAALVWPFTPFAWLSTFSAEGHMFAGGE